MCRSLLSVGIYLHQSFLISIIYVIRNMYGYFDGWDSFAFGFVYLQKMYLMKFVYIIIQLKHDRLV